MSQTSQRTQTRLQGEPNQRNSRPSVSSKFSTKQQPQQQYQDTQQVIMNPTSSTEQSQPQITRTYNQMNSQNQIEQMNDGNLERYMSDMNYQMQLLVAQNEVKSQQSENIMRMQQQRIVQLQQMCEQMRAEMDTMKDQRIQSFDKNQSMQQGLSHLDMLNDFELLSKNTPFSYKQTFINGSGRSSLQQQLNPLSNANDSLNQFIEQYNSPLGSFSQQQQFPNSFQKQQQQQQQMMQEQQILQESNPRLLNSRQSNFSQSANHFKNAASLALNPQAQFNSNNRFDQSGQMNMQPQPQQQQFNPYQKQNFDQQYPIKENKYNPILSKIEQQNDMLMKLIEDMDKGGQNQGNNKNKKNKNKKNKQQYMESSDSSIDSQEDNEDQDFNNMNPAAIEQKQLEKKIQQLEESIKQQKMQNQFMIDNNVMNPDVNYLLNAAKLRNQNPIETTNPQQFQNSVYNQPQFKASQMPGMNPQLANLPTPEQFLSQVQMNTSKFLLPPNQMQGNPGINNGNMGMSGGLMGMGNNNNSQVRPPFINDHSQVPNPNMLRQIFEQQLLNSRKV